jgi:hypothetical protein
MSAIIVFALVFSLSVAALAIAGAALGLAMYGISSRQE